MSSGPAGDSGEWKSVKVAASAMRITNPIRDIVDRLVPPKNHPSQFLSLSIGDPTVFGNLKPPQEVTEALIANIGTHKYDGYAHAAGYKTVRESVAAKMGRGVTEEDVIMASGGSGALEMIVNVLADHGDNMLIPSPGFSLYQTLLNHRGADAKYYKLCPEKGWEVDLAQMESLIDSRTVAIILNNPSNPCGSVYSKEHLQDILMLAEKYHLPIIADEIYGDLTWGETPFYPLASLSKNVPVLSVGGLAKLYIVPGWRLGWIVIHDRGQELLKNVRIALNKQTQLILGPSTLIQSIVHTALHVTPPSYHQQLRATLQEHANLVCDRLQHVPGLSVVKPSGAMYMMLGIKPQNFNNLQDDVEFAKLLLTEENLSILPGTIFTCPNFLRIVICAPVDKLNDACDRIEAFCKRHAKN
jgi:tyrosine aminotransferase